MRKLNQEITDKHIIEQILQKAKICRVAMNGGNFPYLLPFNYGYSMNQIFIHSASKGKKIELLSLNPQVSFEIEDNIHIIDNEDPCKWSTAYRSIIGQGKVQIITDFEQKQEALKVIMKQHGADDDMLFNENQVKSLVILKINIITLSGKQSANWNRLFEKSFIQLESNRLHLKEVERTDVDNIHLLHSIPEVDEFNTLGIPGSLIDSEKHVLEMLDEQHKYPRTSYTWVIEQKENSEFVGITGLILSGDKFRLGEIYYKLLPSFWGKGYATEVARTLVKAGFERFHLHKVEAGVAVENQRSIKVLEKCGMTREGLRRKILPIRGKWTDSYHYAIVEDDPRNW